MGHLAREENRVIEDSGIEATLASFAKCHQQPRLVPDLVGSSAQTGHVSVGPEATSIVRTIFSSVTSVRRSRKKPPLGSDFRPPVYFVETPFTGYRRPAGPIRHRSEEGQR